MADPILPPRRREDFFNPDGTFTLRALRFFESLTDTTNTNTSDIDDSTGSSPIQSQLATLQQQVGSGQSLTVDTTGFTIDTTLQFTEQMEA